MDIVQNLFDQLPSLFSLVYVLSSFLGIVIGAVSVFMLLSAGNRNVLFRLQQSAYLIAVVGFMVAMILLNLDLFLEAGTQSTFQQDPTMGVAYHQPQGVTKNPVWAKALFGIVQVLGLYGIISGALTWWDASWGAHPRLYRSGAWQILFGFLAANPGLTLQTVIDTIGPGAQNFVNSIMNMGVS